MILDSVAKQSNLDCFLQCTTPTVRSQFLPKSEFGSLNRLWHPWEREKVEYFTLNDLWDCYDEWSAYGAGVPIVLNDNEPWEEIESGDGDCFSDSWSTDDSESDKLWRWDGCCSSEDGGSDQDSVCHLNNRLGYLYFQYFETSTPYGRVPLMDKINGLSRRYPGLMVPIYHIQWEGLKDLSTCFLTYHTLSSSFQEINPEDDIKLAGKNLKEKEGNISLPPFGLATYKMQGDVVVLLRLWRRGPRKAIVTFECCRFVAKATKRSTP
ncbi:hypothetical protein V6Z11_1Z072100 [Gossypium hirsutum]